MARLELSSFAYYKLTEDEQIEGSIFTETQLQVLQNKLVEISEEKLGLELDPRNVDAFIQQEASLKGQIDIIKFLMDSSEAMVEARLINAEETAAIQALEESQSNLPDSPHSVFRT